MGPMEDGLYYSGSTAADRPGARRLKKAAVALVGFGALGAGAYFATTVLTGGPHTVRKPGAVAPVTPTESAAVTEPTPDPLSPGPVVGTKSAVRVSALPSPSESPTPLPDESVAAEQVSRLLQAPPQPVASGMVAASGPVMVNTATGTDGSAIRVVSARFDLTARWELLAAADRGQLVDGARCTQNLKAGVREQPQVRPSMMLCWRTAANKSVVTVAINDVRHPAAASSVAVLNQQWFAMG